MGKSRLEAFSDGVIAIIITIMTTITITIMPAGRTAITSIITTMTMTDTSRRSTT